jgi:hypothetical protein
MHSEKASTSAGEVKHAISTYDSWSKLLHLRHREKIEINGLALDLSTLVAVARQVTLNAVNEYQLTVNLPRRYSCEPSLNQSPSTVKGIDESVAILECYLSKGYSVYGMSSNTSEIVGHLKEVPSRSKLFLGASKFVDRQ